jgi:LuxR family quorum sensing-dependent transcriptional regulator
MDLSWGMSLIESCRSKEDVRTVFQGLIETFSFASFTFLDSGDAYGADPYFLATVEQWQSTYVSNGFIHIDPYVAKARRFNMPFDCASIQVPAPRRGPKPHVGRLMEAASDFGLREGLIVPWHFRDELGRSRSSLCVLFWTEDPRAFYRVVAESRWEIQLLLICFM